MFSSSASAPACWICLAYSVQPPVEEPFRLAMIGNARRLFGLGDVLEIFLRAEVKFLRLGEISERFREAFGAVLQMVLQFGAVLAQLLLEQRVQHHRRGARRLPSV